MSSSSVSLGWNSFEVSLWIKCDVVHGLDCVVFVGCVLQDCHVYERLVLELVFELVLELVFELVLEKLVFERLVLESLVLERLVPDPLKKKILVHEQ
ncbi:unnamed protein product [Cochlearia groenlandica]